MRLWNVTNFIQFFFLHRDCEMIIRIVIDGKRLKMTETGNCVWGYVNFFFFLSHSLRSTQCAWISTNDCFECFLNEWVFVVSRSNQTGALCKKKNKKKITAVIIYNSRETINFFFVSFVWIFAFSRFAIYQI